MTAARFCLPQCGLPGVVLFQRICNGFGDFALFLFIADAATDQNLEFGLVAFGMNVMIGRAALGTKRKYVGVDGSLGYLFKTYGHNDSSEMKLSAATL